MTLNELRVGTSVELHPCTDQWMQGDRIGTVQIIGRKYATLRMHVSGRKLRALPEYILKEVA